MTPSFPEHLAAQWHPVKNGDQILNDYTLGSGRKVWWLDDHGHEWEAVIRERVRGVKCPYCTNKKVLAGFNDLATTHPELASEWHPVKNELSVTALSKGSSKKVWWLCGEGHEWLASPNARTSQSNHCPACFKDKQVQDRAGKIIQNPHLLQEWSNKNNFLLTEQLPVKTMAWWSCHIHDEYQMTVQDKLNGHGCPACGRSKTTISRVAPKTGASVADVHPHLVQEWSPENFFLPTELKPGSNKHILWVCSQNHTWSTPVYSRTGTVKSGCPSCWKKNFVSEPEKVLKSFIESLGLTVHASDRTVLQGRQELDLWIPEKKIAVEYNGLYWHNENAGKLKTVHYDKWFAAQQAGVQLIQIWEDDWNRNPELIKTMLAHKLGESQQLRIPARKTVVTILTTAEAKAFLEANHIQGFASGSYYIGLMHHGMLAAVLVIKRELQNTLNIIRYATAANVVGGFTKLLTHVERMYKPDSFITFADLTVSDGKLYSNNGFFADKLLPPDYMYIVNRERKHKFGYRLKRFRNDPELLWEEGLTERELAALNGIPRIWDAGKIRYRKNITVASEPLSQENSS